MMETDEERLSKITLHMTPSEVWAGQSGAANYRPEAFEREGFVHCTDDEAVLLEVANRYYRADPRSYVVLDVDLARVSAPAIYEDEARWFPHVYGPIEREAVRRVRRMVRADEGAFIGFGEDVE